MGNLRRDSTTPVTVYVLTATGFDEAYVGATSVAVYYRRATHIAEAFRRNKLKAVNCWVRRVIESGKDVDVSVVETVAPGGDWEEAERFYITYLRSLGVPLVNARPGGMGSDGVSAAARQKISAGNKGKKRTKEQVKKMLDGLSRWRVDSPDEFAAARKRIGDALRGRKKSPEATAKRLETVRKKRFQVE